VAEKLNIGKRDIQMSVVLAVIFFVMHAVMLWNTWAVDLSAYYYAGHFFGTGQFDQIYAGPPQIIGPEMPPAWQSAVAADGYADEQTYPFIYLPWVAAAFAPISATFDPQTVMNAALLLNLGLMLGSVWLAWRIFSPKTTPLWLWSLISAALLINSTSSVLAISLGQVQILVFFLCLLSIERYKAGAFWWAGMALAMAAALKITPAAFAIIFLWDRNWRALAGFGLTCVVVAAGSLWVVGMPLHQQYFDIMARLNAQVFIAAIAFSVEGFIYQLWDVWNGTAQVIDQVEYTFVKPAWIDLVAKSFFLVGLVAIWGTTRNLSRDIRIPRQFLALSLLVPLAAPLGWVHYFLLTTYMLPGILEHLNRRLASVMIGAFLILFNAVLFYLLIMVAETRVFPQLMLCIPFLALLLGAIVFAPRQSLQNPPVHRSNFATAN